MREEGLIKWMSVCHVCAGVRWYPQARGPQRQVHQHRDLSLSFALASLGALRVPRRGGLRLFLTAVTPVAVLARSSVSLLCPSSSCPVPTRPVYSGPRVPHIVAPRVPSIFWRKWRPFHQFLVTVPPRVS